MAAEKHPHEKMARVCRNITDYRQSHTSAGLPWLSLSAANVDLMALSSFIRFLTTRREKNAKIVTAPSVENARADASETLSLVSLYIFKYFDL